MIYIVEDDGDIREMERYALTNSGYEVREFPDAAGFFEQCAKQRPQLVVLDIMLPGGDGLSLLKRLRADSALRRVPVMMVTAKSSEIDKVRGLDAGADDYVAKPFGIMEFISRVKALLRRSDAPVVPDTAELCGITVDDARHTVVCGSKNVVLTNKEYDLLRCLMLNSGIVLSRQKLMDAVWGTDFAGGSRTVDMHVTTLRQKLGEHAAAIKTVRGVGYKFGE